MVALALASVDRDLRLFGLVVNFTSVLCRFGTLTTIKVRATGLPAGKYGFHVHEFGDALSVLNSDSPPKPTQSITTVTAQTRKPNERLGSAKDRKTKLRIKCNSNPSSVARVLLNLRHCVVRC